MSDLFDSALAAHRSGDLATAVALYRQAASLRPHSANIQNNLSVALKELGDSAGALTAARSAVALNPQNPSLWTNLGNLFRDLQDLDQATAAYHRSLALDPTSVPALSNLGIVLQDSGRIEDALAQFRRAFETDPAAIMAHSNYLAAMHFDPRFGPEDILREHKLWAARHADPLTAAAPPNTNDPNPDRPLRIGYVSAHLYDHVVGRFMLPLLRHHDRENYPAFCYADQPGLPDPVSEKLHAAAHTWRNIRGKTDEQVAQLVRDDRIDVLVDLAMHMSGSRLLVFARKPAPVQFTYLAYVSTTGLSAIDYRLTDPYLDPPGTDSFYTETSLRLPETYWCYQPPDNAPDVGPLPALTQSGVITFSSLNNFAKVTPHALKTWAAILRGVPRSRLLLHAREGSHRGRALDLFAQEGISENRINFIPFVPISRYMDLYNITDIALDPFPYAGGTTTCDALWMGVPVVTLRGQTAPGRGGASLLTNANLPDLIASTPDHYIHLATTLATDLNRLTTLRQSLRPTVNSSPLTNAPRFARNVEQLYRQAWQTWTSRHP